MIYEWNEPGRARELFGNWEETMITSCIENVMGKLYVIDNKCPKSIMACLGCFAFCAGEPSSELLIHKPEGFLIMVPQNEEWKKMIESTFPEHYQRVTRFAIKKHTHFNVDHLTNLAKGVPDGYEMCRIDEKLYDKCLQNQWSEDLVAAFPTKKSFLEQGLGVVMLKSGELVAGASSYTRYSGGIEIEVDTRADERRKSLATCCCAALILECLHRGLYPSWDAQNIWSVHLAEKLGYEFSHEYYAYEFF